MLKHDLVTRLGGLLFAVSVLVASPAVRAQTFPERPITAVVYGAAGTSPDLFARAVTRLMSASMHVPIVIENRPGASGVIATEEVVRAKPDGYTLLFTSSTTLVNLRYVMKNVPFDSQRDLTPIAATFAPVEVLVVRAGLPVHTLPELIDHARTHPGDVSYGAAGYGSIFHLNGEDFASAAGINLLHVAYKGPLAALQDVAAGNVDMSFNSFGGLAAMVSTGRVRIIATLDDRRYKGLPNVPTVAETLPGYHKVDSWFAMMGPARLPQPIVERLNSELNKALQSPQMVDWMNKNVATSLGGSPEQIARMIQVSSARTERLVGQIGLQPQ
ncbi:tripartite tricarboxylate transporter substrate binding protein [Caballeronia sp. LZ028]|uniref:Bug family tripartite tricarboxylate transporter substrate binding protein n=1 Tax=Caballeronia sp. LZ028 TaxID=3038563 RepID=UPI002858E7C7|nr:tripartite tricarboxylate transporter substrate binding protein [Caballeronia sp. LZ028]MDR5769626.1 tripartite tricarboxylate transporter substrate binding protein [Caballeronia sp. LZ028]